MRNEFFFNEKRNNITRMEIVNMSTKQQHHRDRKWQLKDTQVTNKRQANS